MKTATFKLKGKTDTREIWVKAGVDSHFWQLLPYKSQTVWNHSPDGFSWGYLGSGVAQLALAILLEFISKDEAVRLHQTFKEDFLANLSMEEDFEIEINLEQWLREVD